MRVQQFEDKNLSHFSYAVVSEGKMAVIDPSRDVSAYLQFAAEAQATISLVLETHPHADFVSGHAELARITGARIATSSLVGATYPHEPLADGQVLELGECRIQALETPGHSPDSLCFVLLSKEARPYAVFTGDTLFIGDVGRPDLREQSGQIRLAKEDLAAALFESLHQKLMTLPGDCLVYPAHGAGTLCGREMREAASSSIAEELKSNPALQFENKAQFVDWLLADPAFIPAYFPYDVELNRAGLPDLGPTLDEIPRLDIFPGSLEVTVVDTRPASEFRKAHVPGSINLQNGLKFETWLGSVILPGEPFIFIAATSIELDIMLGRVAKIGYEAQLRGVHVFSGNYTGKKVSEESQASRLREHPQEYTIVDVRTRQEVAAQPVFTDSLHIPLPDLRRRLGEIPTGKPIYVHCQGGYRSAAAMSMLEGRVKDGGNAQKVYDLGEEIASFMVETSTH